MSKKSYNRMAAYGIDDMDYIKEFNLDPSLAYTPAIANDAMLTKVAEMNEAAERKKDDSI